MQCVCMYVCSIFDCILCFRGPSDLYIKKGSFSSFLFYSELYVVELLVDGSWKCCRNIMSCVVPPPLPSVRPSVQAVQGRVVGVPERSVTLSFTISDASPEVQTDNIQWTFRDLNGSSFTIPTNLPNNSLITTFSNVVGIFSSNRLSLTLSGLTNDFEGTYTMTATNEAGSDSAAVELVIEGRSIGSASISRLVSLHGEESFLTHIL